MFYEVKRDSQMQLTSVNADYEYTDSVFFDPDTNKSFAWRKTVRYAYGEVISVENETPPIGEYAPFEQRETFPSVIRKYERVSSVLQRYKMRNELIMLRKRFGLETYHDVKKLRELYHRKYRDAIESALSYVGDSPFYNSIASQIRAWCKESQPKYKYPISYRQIQCLL